MLLYSNILKMEIGQFIEISFSEPLIISENPNPVQIEVNFKRHNFDCMLVVESPSLNDWNNTLNVVNVTVNATATGYITVTLNSKNYTAIVRDGKVEIIVPNVDGSKSELFDDIKNRYVQAGYKLPRLIFWNVNSRTQAIPLTENELGVALVSGFSQNVLKMVMSSKYDPYEVLIETITAPRYDRIHC